MRDGSAHVRGSEHADSETAHASRDGAQEATTSVEVGVAAR